MKKVLITGISKGIGNALALQFLKEGYFVIGTYLARPPEIREKNLALYKLNLASPRGIRACAEKIRKDGHRIDVLINNAGVLLDEDETTVVVEKLRKTLDVNLLGTIDFTERILPLLRGKSHIINISSTAGSLALTPTKASHFPGRYPSYKISKAALNMYTCTLALRLKKKDVTVSSVHPGWVRTDMGGPEADTSPEKAAKQIFTFALSQPATGGFWHAGKRLAW